MVSIHHVTAHLTHQKQASTWQQIVIVTMNSVVGESCFTIVHPVSQKKPILSADNVSFKPKVGFTTEKNIFFTETTIFT